MMPLSAPSRSGFCLTEAALAERFHVPARFDRDRADWVFPTALLQQTIAGADPAVRRRVEDGIGPIEGAPHSKLTDDLGHYLRATVIKQRCKAERIARLRLVNRRTLSRRLKAEGTTFRQLANEAQFAVAKQLLADTHLNLTQIAVVLNFSELAAFTHAFRRWSGMAPSAWRKAKRAEVNGPADNEKPRSG
ncbi:helix-turn-helix domain-containing protein [Methylobacterium sp. PvR107]|uniref:helix-turn-helix domain-containing protein n=1 Tax=Methylobacterium sp. PvR107 TaxID=2806597 RepID=UPI001AE80167|nr:helix-turn-helix transcriptional regulator [Methylobacterium sp. PvR107]MBP1180784.1 AraC-like DNA-binding protein [Methylobacterium sp. PvR107]